MKFEDYFLYGLLIYSSIGMIYSFFIKPRLIDKFIFLSIMLWFFGLLFNGLIAEFISETFLSNQYHNFIYTVFFSIVFVLSHYFAWAKDWKFD